MIFRPASTEDLPYILGLEQKFRELRLLGGNDLATHQRQLANPDCLYWIVETEGGPAGFVILRGIHSKDRNVELLRIIVAQPGCVRPNSDSDGHRGSRRSGRRNPHRNRHL